MVEYREIKKRFFYDGVELASFSGRCPRFEEYERISTFYEALIETSFDWFLSELCETLVAEYEKDDDKKKRFGRGVCRYAAEFLATEGEGRVSVKCDIVLKKGRQDILGEFHELHIWDAEQQVMMPPKKDKNKNKKEGSE